MTEWDVPFRVTRAGADRLSYSQTRKYPSPTRGVRAEDDGWVETVRAYALVLPNLAAFSHITAASLLKLPLPMALESVLPLHVTTDTAGRIGRREGLTWHHRKLGPEEVHRWSGLLLTSPLRTWRDLSDHLTVEELVIVADVLLRRGLCTDAELRATFGVRHARQLAAAADLARVGSQSPEETRLRIAAIRRGLPDPTLNDHIIEDGVWIGCGDLVWRMWRVIVDYDGLHHDDPHQRHQDAQTRDDYLAAGWRHVPITKAMSREDAVDRIERALRQQGWAP